MRLGWSSVRVAGYNLQPGNYSSLTAANLQPTAYQERNDQCGNQHHSREHLMMGIVMPDTCWAYKKYNKIISGIQLVLFSYDKIKSHFGTLPTRLTKINAHLNSAAWKRAVGIATRRWDGRSRFQYRKEQETFLISETSRPASYPAANRGSFGGGKAVGTWYWHTHLAPRLKKQWSYTSSPPRAFMTWARKLLPLVLYI